LLDDAALIQHHHPVAEIAHHRHFVGDQHDGQTELLIDIAQQRQDLARGLRIEGGGGFVAEQVCGAWSRSVFGNVAHAAGNWRPERVPVTREIERLRAPISWAADKRNVYPARLVGRSEAAGRYRAGARDQSPASCSATKPPPPSIRRPRARSWRCWRYQSEARSDHRADHHEMSVVRDLCDRMVVLDQGRIVEQGRVAEVFARPESEVTRSLLQDVLPDLPASLAKRLSEVPLPGSQPLLRLRFSGAKAGDPVIAELARQLDVPASVVHGAIETIKDTPIGVLILALPEENGAAALGHHRFLRERTTSVEFLGHVLPAH